MQFLHYVMNGCFLETAVKASAFWGHALKRCIRKVVNCTAIYTEEELYNNAEDQLCSFGCLGFVVIQTVCLTKDGQRENKTLVQPLSPNIWATAAA